MLGEIREKAQGIVDDAESNIQENLGTADREMAAAQEDVTAMLALLTELGRRRRSAADHALAARRSLALAKGYGEVAATSMGDLLRGSKSPELSGASLHLATVAEDADDNPHNDSASMQLDEMKGRIGDMELSLTAADGFFDDALEELGGYRAHVAVDLNELRSIISQM